MRKKILLMGVVLSTLAAFTSCSDNDDGVVVNNSSLQIHGETYRIACGVIWESAQNILISSKDYIFIDKYTDEATGEEMADEVVGYVAVEPSTMTGNFIVSLYGEGFTYMPNIKEVKGSGACISIHLATPNNQLELGKYTYSKDKKPMTFSAYSNSGYNPLDIDVYATPITNGEIEVSKVGDEYKITFECKTSFGSSVKGEYIGAMEHVNLGKNTTAEFENVQLQGLQKKVITSTYFLGQWLGDAEGYDTDVDAALLNCSIGTPSIMSAATENRNIIDVALVYNEDENVLSFESPIKARAYVGHDSNYDLPCHTIFMDVTDRYDEEKFNNINQDSFKLNVVNEDIKISADNSTIRYVMFSSGNGIKGVIKVKEVLPSKEKITDIMPGMAWMSAKTSPILLVDMKCTANFKDTAIR